MPGAPSVTEKEVWRWDCDRKSGGEPPHSKELEEAGADAVWEMGQVDQREEIDSFEFAIDGRGAANAGGDIEIGAEEARWARGFDGRAGGMAAAIGLGHGAEAGFNEVFAFESLVHGDAVVFILRGDGIAAEEIACFDASGVDGQALPEHVQDEGIAEIEVDAGAAEFEHLLADGVVRREIEKLIAVVAEIGGGGFTGLQAISADKFGGFEVADHEVVAEGIEGIDVQAGTFGGGEAFAEFEIEDEKAKALALLEIPRRLRERNTEERRFG